MKPHTKMVLRTFVTKAKELDNSMLANSSSTHFRPKSSMGKRDSECAGLLADILSPLPRASQTL